MTTPQNIDGGVRERFEAIWKHRSANLKEKCLTFMQKEIDAAVQARTKEMIEALEGIKVGANSGWRRAEKYLKDKFLPPRK